jgi:molecular chaperone GrpE
MTGEKKPANENPLTDSPSREKPETEEIEVDAAPEEEHLSEHEREKLAWGLEKEELMNRLLRKQADFDNYRRISRIEKEEVRDYALFEFASKLLPVIDNLERALQSASREQVPGSYLEGLEMIAKQLVGLLEQEGVTVMESADRPFDPNYHHAVMQVEEGKPGCVAEELQKGYLYKNRVLRPAMVKVCQG